MFNYSYSFTLSLPALCLVGAPMAFTALARRAQVKKEKLETVAGIQKQQIFSCSSFDCQQQMKSGTFREEIQDEAAFAKHLAATRLHAVVDRKVSASAQRFSRVNVL